jgi:hypothetical protein
VSTLILFFGMAAAPDALEALDGPAAVGAFEVAFELELEVEALALGCTDYKNQEVYGLRQWKLHMSLNYETSAIDLSSIDRSVVQGVHAAAFLQLRPCTVYCTHANSLSSLHCLWPRPIHATKGAARCRAVCPA